MDKIKHILVGCGAGFFVGIITYLMLQDCHGNAADNAALVGAFVAVIFAAISGGIKEWCDYTYGNKIDWWDFGATCLGGVVFLQSGKMQPVSVCDVVNGKHFFGKDISISVFSWPSPG